MTNGEGRTRKPKLLRLYVLYHHGCDGWIPSMDYPIRCTKLSLAMKYLATKVPKVKRPIYRIVELVGKEPK